MIDYVSEPVDTLADLDHHPKIIEKIMAELQARADVRSARPDTLAHRQGNVEMLDWFLKLPKQIREEEKRAKAAGK